jgi:hypothetical protein
VQFLRGTQFKPIFAILQHAGYAKGAHAKGSPVLKAACGSEEVMPMTDGANAVKALDAWDESGFRRGRAALNRLHPDEQMEFASRGGLTASEGLPVVMGVLTFLDGLDELEKSPERKSTRKADKAALDTFARRGIDEEERKRLRKLVNIVQSSPVMTGTSPKRRSRRRKSSFVRADMPRARASRVQRRRGGGGAQARDE